MKKKMSDLDGLRMKLEQKEADRKMDSMAVEYGKRDSAWVAGKKRKADSLEFEEGAKFRQGDNYKKESDAYDRTQKIKQHTKNKPLNRIDDLGNDTMLNLNDRRFYNQSIIKDDYFDGTEYSKYTHSPIDIIEDNDRMFNKTKTFIQKQRTS